VESPNPKLTLPSRIPSIAHVPCRGT
jgi:hypothetical protein